MLIVGTDFSSTAARAVEKAREFARCLNEDLEIVHVRQSARPGTWLPDSRERAWLERIGVPAARITIRTGTPWVELVRVSDEKDARLIVVGTHGRSGFQSLALGTTAARLVLLSSRPTLLVSESLARRARCIDVVIYDPPIILDKNGRRKE